MRPSNRGTPLVDEPLLGRQAELCHLHQGRKPAVRHVKRVPLEVVLILHPGGSLSAGTGQRVNNQRSVGPSRRVCAVEQGGNRAKRPLATHLREARPTTALPPCSRFRSSSAASMTKPTSRSCRAAEDSTNRTAGVKSVDTCRPSVLTPRSTSGAAPDGMSLPRLPCRRPRAKQARAAAAWAQSAETLRPLAP